MPNELVIAIVAGFGGMLGWGFADFFAKKTIDRIGDVRTLFWGQCVGIVPLLFLFLFNPSLPTSSSKGWFIIVVLGVWSGLSYIPTYIAFGKGKVSLLSPIFATNSVLVVLFSAFLFGEVIPLPRIILLFIIFLGIVLLNGNPKEWLNSWRSKAVEKRESIAGFKEIALAVFLYAGWIIALYQFINGNNWVPILLFIRIFSSLALLLYLRFRSISIFFQDRSLWKYVVFIGLFDVSAFAFLSYGFSNTSFVSIVSMLSSAYSLPTIALGYFFLKERLTRWQIAGIFVLIIGIMLLPVFTT